MVKIILVVIIMTSTQRAVRACVGWQSITFDLKVESDRREHSSRYEALLRNRKANKITVLVNEKGIPISIHSCIKSSHKRA